MKKIDRRIVIVASLIFILGLSFGLMKFLISQKEAPPTRRPLEATRYVQVKVVEYSSVLSPVSETGRMSSISEIDLSAEATGKILQGDIALKKGATFNKGDLLFYIYPDESALSLKAKKSQFLNSLALLLPDISIDYNEYEDRFKAFFSSIDIDRALPSFPDIEDEKLKIFLASKNILSDYYNIRKDELQLTRHKVVAPFSGTLTDVYMEVGAYTGAGGRIAHAIRTDELELEVPLVRFDAEWVKIGNSVDITSKSRSTNFTGTVIRKSQFVNENSQSQSIFVSVRNNNNKSLLAGEYLTATFPGHPVEGVMEIPRNVVFNSNEVFIVKNKRLQNKIVNIVKVNTNTLLFNGLSNGDTLVVQPLVNVYEGTVVTTSLDKPSSPKKEKIAKNNPSDPEKKKSGKKEKK